MTKQHRNILIVLAAFIVIFTGLAYFWSSSNVNTLRVRQRSQLSPVIMIPGSSASVNRFDRLVSAINRMDHQRHSLLKVKVYNDNKITYTGRIRPGDNEPFIVVGFQNNHDGYSNIKKQARMFNHAFNQLKVRYNFNNFKGNRPL